MGRETIRRFKLKHAGQVHAAGAACQPAGAFIFVLLAADLQIAEVTALGGHSPAVVATLVWVARPLAVLVCTMLIALRPPSERSRIRAEARASLHAALLWRRGNPSGSRPFSMTQKRRRQSKVVDSVRPRHVLVADDGSPAAARARAFALMVAAATGARLIATYVRAPAESLEEAERKLTVTLAAAAAAGLECRADIQRPVGITNPGRRIIAAATRHRADVIVVGARGSGLVRKLLGSVSSYVVTHAPMSVSVVR